MNLTPLPSLAGFARLLYRISIPALLPPSELCAGLYMEAPTKPAESDGYTATRHQREVGTSYFDEVSLVISGGESSTTALHGSTEDEQFDQFDD